jgi:hypothetical protein
MNRWYCSLCHARYSSRAPVTWHMAAVMAVLGVIALQPLYPVMAQTLFTEGLQFPQRLIFTPAGNLLVSEGGTAIPNTGRVSIVNRQGIRRSLLEGLPAGPGHGIAAFGPTGMGLDGRTLYLLLGEGDVQVGPPFAINLNGPSSPIFHSVLRIQFSVDLDAVGSSFELAMVQHWALRDGYDVTLRNTRGDTATIRLLTSFPSLMRNVLGGAARHRPSDPYGVWLDAAGEALYIVDASAETFSKVNTTSGRYQVLTRFQPDQRDTSSGVTFVDTVPTAVCPVGDSFLISFLSASPFPEGSASIRLWKPADGTWSRLSPLIGNLTMTNDVICLPGGTANAPRVVSVEYRTMLDFATPSGRVQLIDGNQKRVIAENLAFPTTAAIDPVSGDLFVATLTGTVFRMGLR